MRTSGSAPAARAWSHWALAISPPATTRAWLAMFWALKGAARRPSLRKWRRSPAAKRLFPTPLPVPQTMRALALAKAHLHGL
jgi:hypothetical protein